jgi:2-methylisocitrate lyase-like PEP mutase family enzyme
MNKEIQRAKAETLRAMHDRSRILVLPNAWDAMSARVIEEAGARAIATTSAGVAFAIGYPDGELAPLDEIIAAITRITRVVEIPVSADIESGFAADSRALAETIRRVIEAGAVGINLEDGVHGKPAGSDPLYPIEVAAERVRVAREAADSTGVPLVINARVDVYLRGVGAAESRFEHAVRRAHAYRKAGADCLFVPGVGRRGDIEKLVPALDGPLNVLAFPGMPAPDELQQLGVARLSVGTWITLDAMALTRKVATELLTSGSYEAMFKDAMSYPEGNALLARSLKRDRQ